MITSVGKIMKLINDFAPFDTAEPWDNVGLIIGNEDSPVNRIMFSLDLTDDVINEAIEEGADLIITHHPPIFTPIKTVTVQNPIAKKIVSCLENGIHVISAHTNLDKSFKFGINQFLAKSLALNNLEILNKQNGFGVIGFLDAPMATIDFLNTVKSTFKADILKCTDFKSIETVSKIAICSGASSDFISDALQSNADVYITGDIKYHEAQIIPPKKMILIDLGHFESEFIFLNTFKDIMDERIGAKNYDISTLVTVTEKGQFFYY